MNKYDSQYRNIQISVIAYLQSLYDGTVDQVLAGLSISTLPDKEMFTFKDYPKLSQQADKIIDGMSATLLTYINTQISSVWSLSNSKNDSLVDSLFARIKKEPKISFKSHNEKELDAFLNRKVKDLTISDRVWNLNGSFKSEIESAVSAAIEKGQSAKQLARDIKKYLNEPDKRFRRVRDKFGDLVPSKNALQYSPGQGVYRSSQANALRLAKETINRAYRESDHLRWQQTPFIIGYKLRNSERKATICDVCQRMNGTVFPKSYKFLGLHIGCLCTAIAIMCSDEEFDRILEDENYVPKQPEMPVIES